jgi:NADPH:quinone reductase-like Zn-dependent oxidoreductase
MKTVRAVVIDPSTPSGLAVREVNGPTASASEALVRVAAVGMNRGEARGAKAAAAGSRIGWEFAGTVERAADDGSGPSAGTRVFGILENGAWAELLAVPTRALAPLPNEVTFSQAACVPLPGLTGWTALDKGAALLNRRVLVTGASDGGGYFAAQLAREAGADVVALVRDPASRDLAHITGPRTVVGALTASAAAGHGPYDLIVDSIGGSLLASVLPLLAPDGLAVAFLASSDSALSFDLHAFLGTGGLSLYGLSIFHELRKTPPSKGLTNLAALVASARVQPLIAAEMSWTAIDAAAQAAADER